MTSDEISIALEAAIEAARVGSRILLEHAKATNEELLIRSKRDGSPVSSADWASHRAISEILKPLGIPIISEEGELPSYAERASWSVVWLVDPLDGTAAFLRHREGFAVNIALCIDGVPVGGIVADPNGDRLFVGHRDKGAFLTSAGNSQAERRTLASGPSTPPYKLVISRNESSNPIDLVPPGIDAAEVEFERVSGALKFCLLATGEADIHARSGPYMEWDCAAGDAILRSIGLTTYSRANGKPMVYNSESLYVRGLWVSRV